MRVFDAKKASVNHVLVVWPNAAVQLLHVQQSVLPCNCLCDKSTQLGKPTLFVVVDMATRFAKEFIAWTAMDPQRNLVGHGSAWHENRRFFSEQTGNAILKGYDRWVDVDDVIPNRCSQHCGPHAFGRFRYGIAAQIDKLHIRVKHFVSGPRNSTSGVL